MNQTRNRVAVVKTTKEDVAELGKKVNVRKCHNFKISSKVVTSECNQTIRLVLCQNHNLETKFRIV